MDIPQSTFETAPLIAPLNSMQINVPFDQHQWSTIAQNTIPYSNPTAQHWRPQIPMGGGGPNDDLLRIAVESGIPSFDHENLTWPEITLEQVDDYLLAEVLKLDDYGSDASGTIVPEVLHPKLTSDGLAAQLKHMTISSGKTATLKELKPSLKANQLVSRETKILIQPLIW